MTNSWKVSWNKDKYDYKKLVDDFKQDKISIIDQSKGMAKMVNLPSIGDSVFISCNKQKIFKCKVMTNFTAYKEPIDNIYLKSDNRTHTANNTYLKIKILQYYEVSEIFSGNQRTWTKLKNIL